MASAAMSNASTRPRKSALWSVSSDPQLLAAAPGDHQCLPLHRARQPQHLHRLLRRAHRGDLPHGTVTVVK